MFAVVFGVDMLGDASALRGRSAPSLGLFQRARCQSCKLSEIPAVVVGFGYGPALREATEKRTGDPSIGNDGETSVKSAWF